ncbi:MAG: hypothetical protein IJD88_07425 [Clostridia bacterium]|nr:hypothetical protein [Clostridia bacterium]
MKKFIKWFAKAVVSGILAFAILTGFCFLYYNVPVHSKTADGATDYSWEKNKFYSRGTEGFAMGKTNNEGYVNAFDYEDSTQVNVLIMGSSHMEGYNVPMSKSTAGYLDEMMSDGVVYNIGVSQHTILNCVDNLEAALEKYKPSEYVVIEALELYYSDEKIQSVLDSSMEELESHSGGIIGLLQKNQFFRLMYSQLKAFLRNQNEEQILTSYIPRINLDLYNEMLEKLSKTADKYGAKLIILHQNNLILNDNGSLTPSIDEITRNNFRTVCENNGVIFVDMTDIFIENYNKTHILPHGFSNTSVESGHLNKHGHKLVADALFEIIGEVK